MKPKRILFLENGIGYGGAAICLKILVSNLNRDKYYPIVVTSQNSSDYQSLSDVANWFYIQDRSIDRRSLKKKIESFFLKLRVKGRFVDIINSLADYMINLFPYILRLMRIVRSEKVDMIHLNNDPVSNMGGIIVSRLLKIPCICHVRNPVTWDSATIRLLYNNVDYIITVADWVKRKIVNLGIADLKVQTVNDGRVLEEFTKPFNREGTRRSIGLGDMQLVVGMVGLLIPWKGHKVFIDAARIVEKKYPECKILIIGKAPDSYKEYERELRELVARTGAGNIIFTGHKNNISSIIRVLDVVVHASIAPDPYPNVVIEGMAAGKPVIATNIGGPPEMVEDYKTGFLIPPNNSSDLADKICELLENPHLRNSVGIAAKRMVFKRNSIENHVRKIEDIYMKVLSNS